MANVRNYGWAYVHPTASQAQARGVNKSIQFLTGAVDGNGIGQGSGSARLTFDYVTNQLYLSGNMTASGHVSASTFYGNGANLSGIASFPYNGNAVITGSLHVTQGITASNYLIQNTFQINSSGSSEFGNTNDDTHVFTGSVSFAPSGSDADFNYSPTTNQVTVSGFKVSYRTVTANVTASTSDYIIGVSTGSAISVRLPGASTAGAGALIVVKDEQTGANRTTGNKISVLPSGSETIDHAASSSIAGSRASQTFYSDGTSKWFII
jgi:hypothetical protein